MSLVRRTALVLAATSLPVMAFSGERAAITTAGQDTQPTILIAELTKTLAWPFVALTVAILFYRPLSVFLRGISSRITKLSLFKVELELVPATGATSTPLLDDIRSATTSAQISDSSRTMVEQLQSNTRADYAVIKLGDGREWLTSRLYIALIMMRRMRGVQVFVFVERTPTTEQRLVAVAPADQLRWTLAQRYPWLETAWVRAELQIFPSNAPLEIPSNQALPQGAHWLPDPCVVNVPRLITSSTGSLDPWQARQIVTEFIASLQQTASPVAPQELREWEALAASRHERANWITRSLLTSLLPPEAFQAWADSQRNAPRGRRTRAVLRGTGDFVALTDGDREFVRLVNRRALLEDIAASLGEEPETNYD